MKIWTGAVMTREKAAKLGGESAECQCGSPVQSLEHLVWECPLSEPLPDSLEYFRSFPPARSVAHILMSDADSRDHADWKRLCRRTLRIILALNKKEKAAPVERKERDPRGHDVALTPDSLYSFCTRCFISRRIRDTSWILTRECTKKDSEPANVGSERVIQGHACTLHIGTWKNASQRT